MLLVATASGRAEPVMICPERTSVAPSVKEWQFTVPPFSVEHQVRLSLEARIESDRLKGSNHWLRVAVNGNDVTEPDLLNKRNEFRLSRGLDLLWVKGVRWRLLYSPDFKAALEDKNNPYACPDADPYRFVWDVTRFVQPGANTLRVEHIKVLAKPSTLALRNVQVQVGRPVSPPASSDATPAPTGPLPTFVAKARQSVKMRVSISGRGVIGIAAGGTRCAVRTRTSLPGGRWCEAASAEATELRDPGDADTSTWQTALYEVERSVELRPDHIVVKDTFANRTDKLIGIIVEHRSAWPVEPVKALRLSGRPAFGERGKALNPAHPSVFAQGEDIGLGLVAEDDVFRVHCLSFHDADGMGLLDDRLGLAPGQAIMLEWSIYPLPGADYWDFVNAVRRNWNTNFPIPGPFHFVSSWRTKPMDSAQWAEALRQRGIKYACGGIAKYADGKYAHGTGILQAPEWVELEKAWVDKLRAAAPQVIPTAYFHAQCCTEPDATTKYADSRLLDEKAEHIHYPYSYPLPLYLPTHENSYGRSVYQFLDTLIDTIGVKAVYWDEMSHSVRRYVERAPWDGCSVRIDEQTHEVTGKQSSVALLMQPLKLELIRHVREKVGELFANTQPATRTMTQQRIVRFVETGSYSAVSNTHLGCPWALGNHHQEKTHADATLNVRRILEHGAVYCGHVYYRDPAPWNFTDVMYPITPQELREGMVLGRERIHTVKSGRFGWLDGVAAEVYIVGPDGNRADASMVREVDEDGRKLYEIRMPGDHFAILVRR